MDILPYMFSSFARMLFVVGVGAFTLCIFFAAFQLIMSQGDPQGLNKARMGLRMAIAGLFLVGTAFIIPRVIGGTVIEQAGGAPVVVESPYNCDGLLREQLVLDRNVFTAARLNAVIGSVQSQHLGACAVDVWNPLVVDARSGAGCAYAIEVGGQRYPSGLQDPDPTPPFHVRKNSGRDRDNNIIVHWDGSRRPTDNARCWMYVSGLDRWFVQY